MSMYNKVDTNLDFVQREKEIEKFWKENKIFEKSIEERKGGKPYVFYDGPPTANGKPHIGHVLTRVIKDMIPRYKTMKGYMVPRKAGWDTHGLPVELEVEKLLGMTIPYYAILSLDSFIKISDYLGGMRVFISEPVDYVSEEGEQAAYLIGYIVQKMHKIFKYMISTGVK